MPSSLPSAAVETAWKSLLVAHSRLVEQLDADLRGAHDLPLDWYDALHQLVLADGTMTMGQLATNLHIGPSRCSRRIDRLVHAGLVERRRDERDTRVVHAEMTEQGLALERLAAVTHRLGIQRVFGRFVGKDLAVAMTGALQAAVDELDRPADP